MHKKVKKESRWEKEIQELKESSEDLERYIEELTSFLPVSVCISSPIGIIIDINKAFQKLTGFSEIEVVGKPFKDIFLEKNNAKKVLEKTQEKKSVKEVELTLISKDKENIPVSVFASMRKDVDGNFIGYFLALLDIAEVKKYREELEKLVEDRTKELQERIEEMEKLQKLTIGREIKMVELKEALLQAEEEIKNLKKDRKKSDLNN